jgi:MYXO-CTERM domain-containing protein
MTVADRALGAADRLGERLVRSAIWAGGRCTWVGAEPAERTDGHQLGPTVHRALGPDLYGGTSGVALFLAELSVVSGSAEAARTAIGALKQALSRLDAVPPETRLGLYTGWTGIAYSAARVGTILDAGRLEARARTALRQLRRGHADVREFDLIAGRAGAIAALVALDRDEWLRFAVELGDELLDAAVRSDEGLSWVSPGIRSRRNLTGFSHGASGAAYALLELFTRTGEDRFRAAAEDAVAYERAAFDPAAGNWPDFRLQPGELRSSRAPDAFATLWCHGAPGIALARLRAIEVLGAAWARREAGHALQTTAGDLDATLATGAGNFSLCHGLAGNAEALAYGADVLADDPRADAWAHLAERVADTGLERYDATGAAWPCGTHTDETPGLMLGLAGIGLFLLRRARPATPGVLMLTGRRA